MICEMSTRQNDPRIRFSPFGSPRWTSGSILTAVACVVVLGFLFIVVRVHGYGHSVFRRAFKESLENCFHHQKTISLRVSFLPLRLKLDFKFFIRPVLSLINFLRHRINNISLLVCVHDFLDLILIKLSPPEVHVFPLFSLVALNVMNTIQITLLIKT